MFKYFIDIIKNLLIRLLNGKQLKYSIRDIFAFFKFTIKPLPDRSLNFHNTVPRLKVVVISLPFRLDRRLQITEHLKSLEITFSFFDAIHGKTESSKAYHLVNFSSLSRKFLSPGSVGCIASHVTVWKDLIATSYDGFLILEDDVILKMTNQDLNYLIRRIPIEADIVYLGSGSNKNWFNMRRVSDILGKPFSIRNGAYSYLLFRKGATKLLNEVTTINIVRGGIDTILGISGMRNKVNVYHLVPSFCTVNHMSPSNILNVSDKFKLIHEMELE